MAIATSLRTFLESNHLVYESIPHTHAEPSQRIASAAHQPGDKVAKSVLLKDEHGYLLAVVPATHRLHLGQVHQAVDRQLGLATKDEIVELFKDCQIGAVPPTGLLYDIDTVVDDALLEQPDVYFEAGDHDHLIHMSRENFKKLLGDATHSRISHRI